MKKTIRSVLTKTSTLVVTLSALLSCAFAEPQYVEGQHYKRLADPIPTYFKEGQTGAVWEVFSYGCGHCNAFEPAVDSWLAKKSDSIEFEPVPVMFNARLTPQAQAFYAAKFMDIAPEAHGATFAAIHGGGKRLGSLDSFAEFYTNFDLDKEKFIAMAESFGVQSRVNFAQMVTTQGEVSGTPSLIVNGKYLITGDMAGSNSNMFDVAEFVIAQETAQTVNAEASDNDDADQTEPAVEAKAAAE